MKRIYFLFAMLLGLFGLTNASAQGKMPDLNHPLILSVDQFSSPFSDTGEGSFYALLGMSAPDEITNSYKNDFWHSNWHSVTVSHGMHYFQVEMFDLGEWNDLAQDVVDTDDMPPYPDDYDESLYDPSEWLSPMDEYPSEIVFKFRRRTNAPRDQIVAWGVYGTNDPDATKDACEELAYVETPYGSEGEVIVSATFKHRGYRYLRFYAEQTQTTAGAVDNRVYFHVARFELYPLMAMSEADEAIMLMNDAYKKYDVELLKYQLRLGDGPGMYSEEAFDAFSDAVEALTDEEVETVAEAQVRIDAAEAAMQALIESRNLEYSIPSGYYNIRTAMDYSDGLPKYLLGDISESNVLQAAWGSFETYEDAEKPEEGRARMLWKIENKGDGTYGFVNQFKNGRFTSIKQSVTVEMCREDTTFMALEPVYTDFDGSTWVNIRSSKQESGGYNYLHQNSHGGGSGTGSDVVGWCTTLNATEATPGASEWIFEPVDDDEAQQIIDDWSALNDMDSKIREISQMIREGKDSIATAIDTKTVGVLTEGSQFSSPFSQNDLGGSDGGNITAGVLIDGDGGTYWHSVWNNSSGTETPDDPHYFQVELTEPLTQDVYIKFTRRNTNNNQITDWVVCGTNDGDPSVLQGDCEELFTWNTPWNSGNQTESFKSEPFSTNGYKFIRFYNAGTNSGSSFFHLAEIQLCYDVENTSSQYAAMGSVATKLAEVIERLEEVAEEDYTIEDYNELKAAYEAFMDKFVDPAPLREAIATHEKSTSKVVVGSDPGFWPANSSAAQLDATIAAAKAYDEAGSYTDAQSEKYIADMQSLDDNIPEEANKVKEGKWYRIRFGTEAEFDQYGWTKTDNEAYWRTIDGEQIGDVPIHEENFGKYLTVAKWVAQEIDTDDEGNPVNAAVITPVPLDEVTEGTYIYGDALADIENPDMALFRFVNVGDTAYAIQNKATGLFLTRPTTGGDVRLGIYPALYEQKIVGWGQNSFFAKSVQGTTLPPMHLARNYNVLTQWGGATSGWGEYDSHRGAFYVEEVEDVASSYSFGDFKIKFVPGDIYGRCYAVPVTVKDPTQGELWTVEGLERTPGDDDETPEQVKVSLAKITVTEIPAGRPFIYIAAGDYPEEDEEYDPVLADFSFTFNLETVPQNGCYLKGTFDSVTPEEKWIGIGVGNAEESLKFNAAGTAVGDNRVYITDTAADAEAFARLAELEINYDESLPDAIATAIKNVSRTGDIYTLDGRLVGRGNLNSLTQKGVYIINGTKVTVK